MTHKEITLPNGDELVRFFMKHLVPIFFTFEKGIESYSVVVTAFVLSAAEQWFLVTAGHCIGRIEKITTKHGYQIAKCYLIDSMGLAAKHPEPIAFAYEHSHPTRLSEDNSFDYGLMVLSPYYRQLLEKNSIQPLNEEVWKCQPRDVDFYLLLGMPGELVAVESEYVEIAPTLHKVEPLDKRPPGFSETDAPLFYGHIELGQTLTSIKGMSGGPIFAFHQDKQGQLRYWLTALQSRWLPNSHYIAACPIRLLGDLLEAVMKTAGEN